MISMNIMPEGLPEDDVWRHDFTFGVMVQNLTIEAEHVVHVRENPAEVVEEIL